MADYDAIIVGAGHNGLVCATKLARAGWNVRVLEGNAEIGGGICSGAATVPGFWHDRYATNFGQFVASPAYQELKSEYEELNVAIIRSEKPYASVHGSRATIYTDPERTLAEFAAIGASEAKGWQKLKRLYQRTAQNFLALYSVEMPSAAMWLQIGRLAAAGIGDALRLARLMRRSSRDFAADFFKSQEARGLVEAWGAHLDFGPDVAGGAVFAFVSSVSNSLHGMPIVKGGAGRINEALQTLIERAGGRVVTRAEARGC